MKAVFLLSSVSPRGGGVTEVARQLLRQLSASAEIDVEVVGLQDDETASCLADWQTLPMHTCKVIGPTSFGYAPELLNTLRDTRADLVHAHGLWMYSSLANLRFASRHRPYLVSPHGMLDPWALRNSRWKKQVALALFERLHLDRAACLHALCTAELDAMRTLGLRNPICVVPSGVVLPVPPDHKSRDDSVLDVQPGQRALLHLGRIHPKKGLSELLEALSLVYRQSSQSSDEWVLRVVGWEGLSGYQRELEDKAASLRLGHRVKFLGPMYGLKKAAALGAADAFVLASRSEGMPIAVLEAWAYGLPVLMTPECNLPEGFDCGAAIPIEADIGSLADGLQALFRMSALERREIGQRGRSLVARSFTWESAGEQMRAVYHWLAGTGPYPDCVDRGSIKAA